MNPQTSENSTKKKSWFRRHYILTGVGVLFIIAVISAGSNDKKTTDTASKELSDKSKVQTTEEAKTSPQKKAASNDVTQQPIKTPEVVTAPAAKDYQQIFTFSGNGTKKSEPFTITGSRFKIKYDCSGDLCQAFLYKTNKNSLAGLIMNTPGSTKDETIYYGSGEYYIDANTIGNFTMSVEDYK